jgi:hypothetical protein
VGAILFAGGIRASADEPAVRVDVRRAEQTSPALPFAASAYDSKHGALIVVGGVDRENPGENPSVQRLDLGAGKWSRIEVAGPMPQGVVLPALVYDPKRDALLLFGGWPRGAERPSGGLWRLALGESGKRAWKLVAGGDDAPLARNGCVMVLDAKRDRVLLHGGDGGPHPTYGFTPLDDLWAYDLAASKWNRLRPKGEVPEPRWNHAAVIVPEADRMYIFGGAGYVGEELVVDRQGFELDLDKLEWKRLAASEKLPPPLQGMSLTYDPRAEVLLVVGGMSMADTGPPGPTSAWLRDMKAGIWTECPRVMRLSRRGHAAVYDSRAKTHVISGGETVAWRGNFFAPGTVLHDTIRISVIRE